MAGFLWQCRNREGHPSVGLTIEWVITVKGFAEISVENAMILQRGRYGAFGLFQYGIL